MKRLRHPIRAIREPFGTAGLILACVALIAALAGGAYAASKGLTPQQKKEVKKIAKSFQGTGPQGSAGAAGLAGANGKDGTNGADGVSPEGAAFTGNANGCQEGGVKFTGTNTTVACNGVKGTNGTNGKSVQVGAPTEAECSDGGATVQVEGQPASKKAICNGQTGFTETLPANATETGAFQLRAVSLKNFEGAVTVISFPIPLANALDASNVHVVMNGEEFSFAEEKFVPAVTCLGTVEGPIAPSGHLCVYIHESETTGWLFPAPFIKKLQTGDGASSVGAKLQFLKFGEGTGNALGSFAVTG
ncbi:MAG: hypothetical protein QOF06_536 [Solirubrobacterales bacterium]|jgi:hypothetical protein|nr:hypothetical protein [Solirubrobacterales bacterium]